MQDMVAEGGVFRQQATVRIGREDVVEPRAFAAVLAIVAIARQDAAHGAHAAAKIGLPSVVFKADDRLPGQIVTGEHVVADYAAWCEPMV